MKHLAAIIYLLLCVSFPTFAFAQDAPAAAPTAAAADGKVSDSKEGKDHVENDGHAHSKDEKGHKHSDKDGHDHSKSKKKKKKKKSE